MHEYVTIDAVFTVNIVPCCFECLCLYFHLYSSLSFTCILYIHLCAGLVNVLAVKNIYSIFMPFYLRLPSVEYAICPWKAI